ncbi:MAG: bifunctional ADP-heptose synthase [Bacteroidales bacterium]|jgi:rfaE bifunctional protein kinase chain/domain|nr:bifunctional ADP-heptose synthase [Bacteroidales bacterium]MEE1225572.1 bifunctional ADP-heptose synthase [Bacteroidales bacterium]
MAIDFVKVFDKFNSLNILIIGDVMIDAYWWGGVNRISPEAPVPVCAVNDKESRLGGAANVALNIAAMGANPILCSVVGEDYQGHQLCELMKKQNMDTNGIVFSSNRPTTVKTRIIGNKTQMLRIDEETDANISLSEEKIFLDKIESIINTEKINAIIFQDYDKGVITEGVITKIIEIAKRKNIPVTVDPKKRNFTAYKNVDLFKPNLKELKEGLKIDFDNVDKDVLVEASLLLHYKQKIEKVFITLSERGVFMMDFTKKEAEITMLPACLRKISDVSGAGDTVISLATLCLALGLDSQTIANVSNFAGGLVCESVGVVPIDKNKLLFELLK